MSGITLVCDYSSSDSEIESDLEVKKRTKLPAPDLSKVSIVASEPHIDDPSQHSGRSRSFPHVRGNWATFVFIKYSQEHCELNFTDTLYNIVQSQNKSWERCKDVHISLSKTFTLSYHLISPFTTNLQKAVSNTESFVLEFSGIKVYCNEEKTRTFIALAVDHFCQRNLLSLTQKVDKILIDYNLPKFYEDPSFHMSIFWINGDKRSEVTNILNELNNIVLSYSENKSGLVDKVCCKSGNKFFQYYLL